MTYIFEGNDNIIIGVRREAIKIKNFPSYFLVDSAVQIVKDKFYQMVPLGINIELVQSFIPFWIRSIGNMSGFFDAVGRSQYLNSDVRIRTVHWKRDKKSMNRE